MQQARRPLRAKAGRGALPSRILPPPGAEPRPFPRTKPSAHRSGACGRPREAWAGGRQEPTRDRGRRERHCPARTWKAAGRCKGSEAASEKCHYERGEHVPRRGTGPWCERGENDTEGDTGPRPPPPGRQGRGRGVPKSCSPTRALTAMSSLLSSSRLPCPHHTPRHAGTEQSSQSHSEAEKLKMAKEAKTLCTRQKTNPKAGEAFTPVTGTARCSREWVAHRTRRCWDPARETPAQQVPNRPDSPKGALSSAPR